MGRRCPALAPSDRWPRRPKKGRLRPGALGSTILPALLVHFGVAGPSGAAGVPGFVTSATSDLTYGCFFQPSVVFLCRNVDYQVLMQTYSLNIIVLPVLYVGKIVKKCVVSLKQHERFSPHFYV